MVMGRFCDFFESYASARDQSQKLGRSVFFAGLAVEPRHEMQGLKPTFILAAYGTTEVMP
jgi:hypothetical protein